MRVKLDKGAYMPTKTHLEDAGYDIYSPIDADIPPRGNVIIDSGVHIALPIGTAGILQSRSGLYFNHDIISQGLIDPGYSGSIGVKLCNLGDNPYHITRGDRITQMIVVSCCLSTLIQVDDLEESERGINGFGSSGK